VQTSTGATYKTTPERIAQLLREIEAAGFFALNDDYTKVKCNDCFYYFISITQSGQTKTVEAVDAQQLPQQLRDVVSLLRRFVAEVTS
jgi:hypothetical protein